jgi:hypothetical protein
MPRSFIQTVVFWVLVSEESVASIFMVLSREIIISSCTDMAFFFCLEIKFLYITDLEVDGRKILTRDWIYLTHGSVACCCVCGNEASCSTEAGNFLNS